MKVKVRKAIIIPDGEHEGVIINIRYREKPFQYADLHIEFPIGEDKVTLRVGYPLLISANSKLGQLLTRFGHLLVEGDEVDPDDILIGNACSFRTFQEKNSSGSFSRIAPDSVKPK